MEQYEYDRHSRRFNIGDRVKFKGGGRVTGTIKGTREGGYLIHWDNAAIQSPYTYYSHEITLTIPALPKEDSTLTKLKAKREALKKELEGIESAISVIEAL